MIGNYKEYINHLNAAHNAIASGYASAIENYNRQKKNFKNILGIESQQAEKEFLEKLNDELTNETDQELGNTFDQAFSAIQNDVESLLANMIDGKNNTDYQILVKRFEDLVNKGEKGEVKPERLYENIKKDIEKFLDSISFTRSSLVRYIEQSVPSFNGKNNKDIANNLYGYARKLILSDLKKVTLQNVSFQHYKTALKGYYKEELLVPALQKVLSTYNQNIGAKRAGGIYQDGAQIQMDIILGTVSLTSKSDLKLQEMFDNIPKNVTGKSKVNTDIPGLIGGIQSKSWIAPWENVPGNTSWLSFGNHADLLPQGDDAYYWHAGVTNVMSNLINVVGENNFMFSTGGGIYFTSSLLARLRAENYVLAFYKRTKGSAEDQKIVDGGVGAMKHTV